MFTPAAPAEQARAAPPAEQAPAAPTADAAAAPPSFPAPQEAPAQQAPPAAEPAAAAAPPPPAPEPAAPEPAPPPPAAAEPAAIPLPSAADGPYVTPLVRKLAAEHGVDLAAVTGTGVGGRIRKQDVLEAARAVRESAPAAAAPAAAAPASNGSAAPAPAAAGPAAAAPAAAAPATAAPPAPATPARPVVPSTLRGTTERMSRARQVIARRMVESLQTSAQLTTVVEADVTAISRLRDRAKADFEAREGVKLSFLPFFALATLEALKVHPRLNASIDAEAGQVIYHDDEHLGIAVDTERGLMVPVIQNAGDLNIGGLARKIADLAARTRAGQVSPDDLAGGTFTLTNTGSRGALFDTPIINQPQVAILGTGSVVKRAVVVEDPALGEVITVRSMVYLALTYDHRLVDGADAARFLTTVKERLEEGAFEAELGL
jgi:2-oxoglutarate dehydrogenase E2 component (dihydrolipoamide succinyltransferase)